MLKYDMLGGYPGHECRLEVSPYLSKKKNVYFCECFCECGWHSWPSLVRKVAVEDAQVHQRITAKDSGIVVTKFDRP